MYLSKEDSEKLIHAFITSRLDYCNGLFTGVPKSTVQRVQLIQNAAARVLTGTKKFEHITPVLRLLHWLPVKARIDFKILLLVYKALNGLAPQYIRDMLIIYEPARLLRSTGSGLLTVPRCNSRAGEAAFCVYAPKISNTLPVELREASTLNIFKKGIKTFLFTKVYD